MMGNIATRDANQEMKKICRFLLPKKNEKKFVYIHGFFFIILVMLMNARGDREQEVYKVTDDTQVATLWAFPGSRLMWRYSDGSKFRIKTSGRYSYKYVGSSTEIATIK